jgi:hypothetical protein
MEMGAALRSHFRPSDVRSARQYVVLVRTDSGQTFRSVPLSDYETAEQVAKFSRLDADVVEAHIEEVLDLNGEQRRSRDAERGGACAI